MACFNKLHIRVDTSRAEKVSGQNSAAMNLRDVRKRSRCEDKALATMATCVVCNKPLTLYIEPADEDEEGQTMEGSASADTGSYVDDDVQLQCGCHFHWSVISSHSEGREQAQC